ncbi:hypothetical protein H4217_000779 [Coemansia sp. RSA 1939]|nr:hypothetical protein H4217_000779 [Coemansia sp. RSA 1939]
MHLYRYKSNTPSTKESDCLLQPPHEEYHRYASSSRRSSVASNAGFSSSTSEPDHAKYSYGSIAHSSPPPLTTTPLCPTTRSTKVPDTIPNNGSTARDFYAAERNFLSWVRLSIALASTGAMVMADTEVSALTRFGRKVFAASLHFVAAFTLIVALVFLYHTHAQLAVLHRPLRWSRALAMSVTIAAAVTATASAFAAAAAIVAPNSLYRRSDLLNYRGAVLVKNGIETSCDIALIDNKAAFVSASCIAMNDDGSVDSAVQHDIYFDQYQNTSPDKTTIDPTGIHVHPKYDHTTLANNIAIIEFDYAGQGGTSGSGSSGWTSSIAVYPAEWSDTIFVRRQLVSAQNSTWGIPQVKSYTSDKSDCSSVSTIFADNQSDMRCNNIQVNSIWNLQCPFPYGAVYGMVSDTIAIAGLHSYTLMPTNDYCNGDRGLYYYTMLYNYVEWGESVIGRTISKLVADTGAYDATSKSGDFGLADTSDYNPEGWGLFASNMRFPALWNPSSADSDYLKASDSGSGSGSTSSIASSSDTNNSANSELGKDNNEVYSDDSSINEDKSKVDDNSNGNEENTENSSAANDSLSSSDENSVSASDEDVLLDNNPDNSTDSGAKPFTGLSKSATIAVAVAVPLGVIFFAMIGFLIYKKQHSRAGRIPRGWGHPHRVKSQIEANEDVAQIGGVTQRDNLPSYDELHEPYRSSHAPLRVSYLNSPISAAFEKHI